MRGVDSVVGVTIAVQGLPWSSEHQPASSGRVRSRAVRDAFLSCGLSDDPLHSFGFSAGLRGNDGVCAIYFGLL